MTSWSDAAQVGGGAIEGALTDLTVLELGQAFMAPYCAMLMQRLGAEVIKIEPPQGEPYRRPTARKGVEAVQFGLLNAGKLSLRLDLKQRAGKELFVELAKTSDIVVQNYARAPSTDSWVSTLCLTRILDLSSHQEVVTAVRARTALGRQWISRSRLCRE